MYAVEHQLTEELDSITLARDLTRLALAESGYTGLHDDALLVVSELVTNALVHGAGAPALHLVVGPSRVRIEVRDSSPLPPEPREPGPKSGWGLNVIERLSIRWGSFPQGSGKVVWCELAAVPAPIRAN
ncbi:MULTISPECIES: ATP-binding protein [unclassified Nonomuraea]|uniref:ATP-binding protein n=1 Tax=unclassified Nonomuraea TaxID=2593643 RepID=UPI003406670C